MSEKKRVLTVDDAGLVRRYYRDILERAGYEVEEAINGLEAIEKLLRAPADLIIVDINMPQMDGLSLLRHLRRQPPPLCAIPVLVSSTEAETQDMDAARVAGANLYLVKPVKPEVLVQYAALLTGATL
jgi:two-component system, chemotaxis family, chemotaxis protein CheY